MSSGPGGEAGPLPQEAEGTGRYRVDARAAQGVLVGEQGTQVNYFYRGTWTDGVAPVPLVGMSGEIDSPYRGLSAFGERDAGLFFGREAAAGRVLELMSRSLEGTGLVVLSGVSGAGKSSLLRAAGCCPGCGGGARRRCGGGVVAVPGVHPGERAAPRPRVPVTRQASRRHVRDHSR